MDAAPGPSTRGASEGMGVGEPEPAAVPADEAGRFSRLVAALATALPTISRLGTYTPGMLRDDLIAGLALSALLVPVGMGYAEAAGLPAIAGLYATIGALVAYFLFGPSRILVFGPDSALLPLVAAAVVPLAAGDPARVDRPRGGPRASWPGSCAWGRPSPASGSSPTSCRGRSGSAT